MGMIKVGVIGLIGVLMAVYFKTSRQEYGIYIGFAVSLVVFFYIIDTLSILTEQIESLRQVIGENNKYFFILLKAVGITYICEFCAGVCKDAGYGAVATQIEVFGKLSILMTGMPVLFALLQTIQGFAVAY